MQRKMHLFFALMMLSVSSALAQITTSGLNGRVTEGGEEVIGAHVEAIHQPSGTRYTAVTNTKGQYAINGMRVGGPYQIIVSYIGFETKVVKGVTLQLGETYRQDVLMTENVELLKDVIVTASASKFAGDKNGATTNISNQQMVNMPTVSRSIPDFTRLSPYGGNGMTFQGSDGRTATFTVDGANFNNDFGLTSELPGSDNPISIEAIEEMQIVISPFDVRQSGFIGGGVNAITKSGTNIFKGTAYVYHQNENIRGDAVDKEQIPGAREKDRKTTYGVTLGGPIVKDKLFFFVNGELVAKPTIASRWRASQDGIANPETYLSRTTVGDLKTVSDYVYKKYGYDTGSFTNFPADEKNYKALVRLDWNINNSNKLAVRYNFTQNRMWYEPNPTSMDGGPRVSGGRMSQYSMSYANSMYAIDNLVHSVSLDLNSRFSNSVSNQLLATFTKKDDVRRVPDGAREFPMIDILKDDQAYISLGYELFSYNNAIHATTWNIKDDVIWYAGDHKVMGGVSFEHQMADNSYMRNGTGYYRYSCLEDFLAGGTPEIVNLTFGYNDETKPAARVRFNRIAGYLQDDWNMTDRFKLSYGIRLDGFVFNNNDLMTNNELLKVDYDGRHIDTGKWPGNSLCVSPRIGFVWDVLGNKSLKVRGGTGIFTGRLPLVFFINMPSNSGMIQNNVQIGPNIKDYNLPEAVRNNYGSVGEVLKQFTGDIITDKDVLRQKLINMGFAGTINPANGVYSSGMCGVDPSFKMPQVWKSSVAIDYAFPTSFPLSVTGEFIFNKNINSATIDDWSVPSVAGFARFNGADNRAIFHNGYQTNSSLYVLRNTGKGYGYTASVTLNARPFGWMDFMASYTYSVHKEITSLPGSSASSVLNYIGTVDGPNLNNMKLHDAINTIPHRFIAALNLHDKCCNHYSIIYEAWNGSRNSTYMLVNDMNNDSYSFDLLYIPTDEQVASKQFRFTSGDDRDRFMAYVHNNDYLSKHQGEYAGTYATHSPFVHRVDFSFKHDFQVNWGNTNHKLQLSFDMKNVLNLFNSSWGVMKYGNPNFTGANDDFRVLKYEGVDADGYATFSTPAAINGDTKTWVKYHDLSQCWYASIGAKYFFNGERQDACGCKEVVVDNDAINALRAENEDLTVENYQR